MSRSLCPHLHRSPSAAAASPPCSARPTPARRISPSSACSRMTSASSACRSGCSPARSTTRSSPASAPAKVALITGEEKIKPPSPRFYVCTVEAMPLDLEADFVAVDEIQLAADGERGHIFTDRLFHARGLNETLLLGAATMRDAIREVLPGANLVSRPRLSTLSYAGDKKITRLPRRSAIVAFSANDVYAIAELVQAAARRRRGRARRALSPRTRNAQVALYQNGDVDFLVATDAIGMGLNLDLDHVAFAGMRKFDGQSHRNLTPAELGQIAGRAGRHMNDGTFGVTGQVRALRARAGRPAREPHLRSGRRPAMAEPQARFRLDRAAEGSPCARRPTIGGSLRARMVDDVIALERCEPGPGRARHGGEGRPRSALLWEMCQIPDYRKISAASHAELVATLYRFVMSDRWQDPRRLVRDARSRWPTAPTAISTRCRAGSRRSAPGPSSRIMPQWLDDPEHWQGRTRAIEDTLVRRTARAADASASSTGAPACSCAGCATRRRSPATSARTAASWSRTTMSAGSTASASRPTHRATASTAARRGMRRPRCWHGSSPTRADALAAAPGRSHRAQSRMAASSGPARRSRGSSPAIRRSSRDRSCIADEHLSRPDRERVVKRLEAWLDAAAGDPSSQPLLGSERGRRPVGPCPRARLSSDGESRRAAPRRRRPPSSRRSTRGRARSCAIRRALRRLQRLYPGPAEAGGGGSAAAALGAPFGPQARHRRRRAAAAPARGAHLGRPTGNCRSPIGMPPVSNSPAPAPCASTCSSGCRT